jgi:hypothetical protein
MTVRISSLNHRMVALSAGVALTAGALTACQSSAPDLDAEAAKQFQSTVLWVTQAVADGELQTARDTIVAFDTELEQAAADGSVSFARHKRIDAALAAVLADVDAAIAAQAPEPQPEATEEPVTPTTPATDDEDEGDDANEGDDEGDTGNNGDGNSGNNGKGNGNHKEKAPKKDK